MENQHRHIKGYRELSDSEIALMNRIKEQGCVIASLLTELELTPGLDRRWLAIGRTDLQTGLMALTRAIAQPTTF